MAVLENKSTGAAGLTIEELCPEGTFVAVIGRIDDVFGVSRPKFDNPNETELVDETRFTFGVVVDQRAYRVQTFAMRISGNPKSNLVKFLTQLIGRPPQLGWDYCELQGTGCVLTVAHKQNRDGSRTYGNVVGVRPVKDSLGDYSSQVPQLEWFDWGENEPSVSAPAPSAPAPLAPPAPAATVAPPQAAPRPAPAGPPPAPAPAAASAPAGWSPDNTPGDGLPF